jgi:hypothetical protein
MTGLIPERETRTKPSKTEGDHAENRVHESGKIYICDLFIKNKNNRKAVASDMRFILVHFGRK